MLLPSARLSKLNSNLQIKRRHYCSMYVCRWLRYKYTSKLKVWSSLCYYCFKANARAKLILKSFLSRNPITMTRTFIIYVRPLLEYCSPLWSPHFKQDIDLIENVQCSFTRKLYYCCNLVSKSYDDRLTYLGLQRLELRRIYANLIYMFKLIHNNISSSLINVFKFNNQAYCRKTRGHIYKLFFNRSNKLVFSKFFTNRIVPIWNHLSDSCFNGDTILF